jgi:hypothetical protein
MAASKEIEQRVALESERRSRLAVPAVAGGVLYLLSGIILSSTLSALPAVGLVQGFAPMLRGEAGPLSSPRSAEVTYIDHHAFGLIAGSVLTAIAIAFLTLVLLFLLGATLFRRPESWPATRPLVLAGGAAFALLSLIHWIAIAIQAHSFVRGHDFSAKAVDQALLTAGSLGVTLGLLGLFAALALAIGIIAAMVAAMRTGLLPRWLAVLGIFSGLLFLPLFGTTTLELIPAFWLVATGILLMGRWPSGDPPAWASGEARPWPTAAEMRAKRA